MDHICSVKTMLVLKTIAKSFSWNICEIVIFVPRLLLGMLLLGLLFVYAFNTTVSRKFFLGQLTWDTYRCLTTPLRDQLVRAVADAVATLPHIWCSVGWHIHVCLVRVRTPLRDQRVVGVVGLIGVVSVYLPSSSGIFCKDTALFVLRNHTSL
jgi:hypothetical protein